MSQSEIQAEVARLRAQLARSEERARLVIEQAADALYILNGEGRFIDVSARATETTGYTREELLNMHLWQLEKDEHWTAEGFTAFYNAQPVGMSMTSPGEHRRKDGSIYPVEARINFVEMDGEKVLMVFIRDMTAAMVAQDWLRSFEAMAENAQDAIIMFDPDVNVVYANPFANAMYGTDSLVATPGIDMWLEEDLLYLQSEVMPQVVNGGFIGEVRQKRMDGTVFHSSSTAFPIRDDKGNPLGFGLINRDITEEKAARAEVENRHRLLDTVLKNIPSGVLAVEAPNGRSLLSNPRAEELLGRGIAPEAGPDLIGDVYQAYLSGTDDLYPPERMPIVRAMSGESIAVDDMEVRRPDGSRLLLEVFGTPILDGDGNAIGSVVNFQDITERKLAEQEREQLLTESMKLRAIIENTTDFISMTDLDGNITYVNPAGLKMVGLDSVDGVAIANMHPPECAERTLAVHVAAVMEKGIHAWENLLLHTDGHAISVSQVSMLIRDDAGQPIALATVMRDISEQRKAAEAVRQSQQLLQTFLDNIPAMIFAKDYEGRLILTNTLLCEAFGMTKEEMMGKTIYDLMPDKAMADAVWLNEKRVIETREVNQGEAVVQQPDGEHIKYQSSFPLINENDEAYAVGVISMDITEQKRQEAERERLQQEVIDAQKRALQDLSTPIIPLMEDIIILPLVGSIDSYRARDITRALLAGISQHRAKTVIVDITGVPVVDSSVADHLNKTIMAARLKGARTIVTGLSDAVAETIVDLGIDWSAVDTLRDLQTGLTYALSQRGLRLEHGS